MTATLRATIAAHGIPDHFQWAAMKAAQQWLHATYEAQAALGDERTRQLSAAVPHVEGAASFQGRCLTCLDAWPCAGFIADIDAGRYYA